ncbi:conserved hypothetical protein [Roseovarius sp. EC-HK134]|nr:conserved hypothetical protein [Roseovarius sp. EC-SD190]VVT28036.1 conserved hypothetical protein [Roseovarius sp. EC-HK134]
MAAGEDFGSRSTLAAAEATFALVTSEFLLRATLKTPLFHRTLGDNPCISCGLAARH